MGKKIRCSRCGYEWIYRGDKWAIKCPYCYASVKVKKKRKCIFCGKVFYTTSPNQKYCSVKCYGESIKIWKKKRGEKERLEREIIRQEREKKGLGNYLYSKEKMLKMYDKCLICGYDRVLDVHHIVSYKDGGGNSLDNLVVLCPNCHALIHRGHISRDDLLIKIKGVKEKASIE